MSRLSTFQEVLSGVLDAGVRLVDWRAHPELDANELPDQCAKLLGGRGEASGVALAAQILERIYLYDLDRIEVNHEAFVERREVTAARAVRSLLPSSKKPSRGLADA